MSKRPEQEGTQGARGGGEVGVGELMEVGDQTT